MAKETLDTLKKIEEKAKITVEDAKVSGEKIIEDAKTLKAQKLQNLETTLEAQMSDTVKKAEKNAEGIKARAKADSEKVAQSLKSSYDANKGEAIEAIVQSII